MGRCCTYAGTGLDTLRGTALPGSVQTELLLLSPLPPADVNLALMDRLLPAPPLRKQSAWPKSIQSLTMFTGSGTDWRMNLVDEKSGVAVIGMVVFL